MQMPRAFINRKVLGFGIAIALAVASLAPRTGHSQSQVDGVPAVMTVLSLISVTEDFNLNFGTIAKPSTGTSTTFKVDTGGGMNVTQNGGADGQALGVHSVGSYDIEGTAGEAYTLAVTPGACDGAGLTLSLMTIDVGTANTDAESGVLSTLDDLDTEVGGTLTVTPAATVGPHSCTYTITAQY